MEDLGTVGGVPEQVALPPCVPGGHGHGRFGGVAQQALADRRHVAPLGRERRREAQAAVRTCHSQ